MHNANWSHIVKWKWLSRICNCGDLTFLPVSMIRFSNIIMLIHQYRKNQPIYRYGDSSCWFTNIGQLGHLPISENRISDIRKYDLYFTEMDKQSCEHTTVSSPWTQFSAIQLKTFGENILGAVSIRKTVFPGMAIPMLKIRRHSGCLIFNMEIAIRR